MGDVFGVIAPHPPIIVESVGGERARVTAASIDALREAADLLRSYDPDTLVVMSPHAPAVSDAFSVDTASTFSGSFAQFGAAYDTYAFDGDPALALAIIAQADAYGLPVQDRAELPSLESGALDHGVMVPLHFLDPDGRLPLVVISLSWLPYEAHRRFGRAVASAASSLGRRIAFVASGDCSHRLTPDAPAGFSPRAHEFDQRLVDLLSVSDFDGLERIDGGLVEAAGECGLRSFITMGGVAEPATTRVLAYEGPWGVGYLTAVVNEHLAAADRPPRVGDTPGRGRKGGRPGDPEHEIVALARLAIERFVADGTSMSPPALADPALPPRAGVFVSLHRLGELRGCIGTIQPVYPTLAEEVARNAVEAATRDPRFPRLGPDELGDLDVKVDVLHPPEPCSPDDLDPARYGVIVSSGPYRGLLLPDLEGVDTVEQQLRIASHKAGIQPGSRYDIERFRVDRYS